MGLLYAEQKRYKEAAKCLEKATIQSNANNRIYYNLGLIYQYLNDDKNAESSLLKGNSKMQNDFDMLFALADFYVKRNRFEEAKRYALELENKFPSKPAGKQILNYINQSIKQ